MSWLKTESTKLIIKQLVDLCSGNTQLERQILQVCGVVVVVVVVVVWWWW